MRRLPALVAGASRWHLPMADRSADALIDLALADDPRQAAVAFAESLADDPPLAVWIACVAWQRDRFHPRSIDEMALWLAEHGLDVFRRKDSSAKPPTGPNARQAEAHGDLVQRSLELAAVAALLASSESQPEAEETFLLALVNGASDWLDLAAGRSLKAASGCLPDWLGNDTHAAALAWITQAKELLSDGTDTKSLGVDLEACREQAAEGRRRWMETVPAAGDRLEGVVQRLGRLADLESHFQETLEAEKLDAMAEFAAGAGHEINNPLAIIGGWAQLLLKEEANPERRRELALMNAQVKRAHEMIADIRLFARPPEPEIETVELVALIDDVIEQMNSQAVDRATFVSRSGDEGSVEIEADPTQLKVALAAMCKNSLEAIGRDGQIDIRLEQRDRDVEIVISDNGPGIEPEHRRHLFDPFYSSRQAGRGLGFGLSKCWRIVAQHQGRIEVESAPGEGAVFRITLPGQPAE